MKKVIVISDFDGTITTKDTLVEILDKFAPRKWREIAKLVHAGKLGTKIALRKELALCKITKKEFVDFLNKNIKIDRAFIGFLGFCRKNNIRFIVVSGGFGLNVETIFKKYGIKDVPYYANEIKFPSRIRYPYPDKSCKDCGHCKAPYIRKYRKKGYFTVYIGDSVTDRCPARIADMVFAKHHLAEFCRENNIPYAPYSTFKDIKTRLAKYILQ